MSLATSFPLMLRRGGATLGRNASIFLGVTTTVASATNATFCAGDDEDDSFWNKLTSSAAKEEGMSATLDALAAQVGSKVQNAVDSGIPTQLSYGFVSGYCSGLALKKAGRAAAVVLGLGFVTLQTLQYSGYIQVDHGKLKKDVESMFDLDKDGDFDGDDAKLAYAKILAVLEFNMPAGGGFGAGFLGGLRSG